jgi:hypothetical protein
MSEKLFTQDEVNRIVQERLAQEKNKFNADQAQLLQESLSRAEAAERQLTEYKTKMQEQQILSDLENELAKGNCIQPKQIASLLKQNVSLTQDGKLVYKSDGKEVSLQDGVKNYLGNNTWCIKANPQGGGGAPVSGGGTGGLDAALREAFGLASKE